VERMQKNVWWKDFAGNRDEFVSKLGDGQLLKEVEGELIALVNKHFGPEPAILAGNSIYNDRLFIKQWMPALDLKLNYRMLDVSAWKVLMQGKYGVVYEKKEVHRAFDDIQASIAELQHYLDWLKQNDK
jgi:oligoribonuclease